MNSNILQSIGLGNLDIAYLFLILLIFIVVLFIIIILQMKKLNRLQKRISKFMTGKDAKSLEKDIVDNKFLKINVDKNKKDIRTLYKNMEHAFQKIGLIKYDAFQQMGGKLSFSLALLDENNNGFILNSVHSTEGCYTYTKEIKSGECAISLGEEEQQALDMAIGE